MKCSQEFLGQMSELNEVHERIPKQTNNLGERQLRPGNELR